MQSLTCSKMWTDIVLRFPDNAITTCCKREPYDVLSIEEISNPDVFLYYDKIIEDKKTFVNQNNFPTSCEYCAKNHPYSIWNSWNIWKNKDWSDNQLINLPKENHVNLIEFMLSTICNQSCMYCNENISSQWAHIKGTNVRKGNPIWKQKALKSIFKFIDKSDKVIDFNFTGGEPFLDDDIFYVLDNLKKIYVDKKFNNKPCIYITTNANFPKIILNKFFNFIDSTIDFFEYSICVSFDSLNNNEIIRDGVNPKIFNYNLDAILKNKKIKKVVIAPTINSLNIKNLGELFVYLANLREKYNRLDKQYFSISNNIVESPVAMSPKILPEVYKKYVDFAIDKLYYISDNNNITIDDIQPYLMYLKNLKSIIGTARTNENLSLSKKWFEDQGKFKNKNYFQIIENLEDWFSAKV